MGLFREMDDSIGFDGWVKMEEQQCGFDNQVEGHDPSRVGFEEGAVGKEEEH